MRNTDQVCKMAMERRELKDYLVGTRDYRKLPDKYEDNEKPDCETLLYGMHHLYSTDPQKKYIDIFETTLRSMFNGRPIDLKYALIYLGLQLDLEYGQKASFAINMDAMLEYARSIIKKREIELKRTLDADGDNMWNFIKDFDEIQAITCGRKVIFI